MQSMQSQTMAVVCPQGAYAGQTINIQTPSGGTFAVDVPAGVGPGQEFTVSLPTAPPIATAVPTYNPQPTVVVTDGYGGGMYVMMDEMPDVTTEEERLLPLYNFGRRIKSQGIWDSFFVVLFWSWILGFWYLLVLFPLAMCGYYAGKTFRSFFAYMYLLYQVLLLVFIGAIVYYVTQVKKDADQKIYATWWIIIIALFVLLELIAIRMTVMFIGKLHALTDADLRVLQNPGPAMRLNARMRSGSAYY